MFTHTRVEKQLLKMKCKQESPGSRKSNKDASPLGKSGVCSPVKKKLKTICVLRKNESRKVDLCEIISIKFFSSSGKLNLFYNFLIAKAKVFNFTI